MVISGVMKLIGSGMEFFLVIPGIGGTFILSLLWIPLLFMLVSVSYTHLTLPTICSV